MPEPNVNFPFRYDPRLLEEAVFLAVQGCPEEHPFHTQRERVYKLADAEDRDRAFQDYHASWFTRLRLGAPIEHAFAEQPCIAQAVRDCVVGRALRKKEEGAELFVSPAEEGHSERERRSVGLLLRPESLLTPDILVEFLRHEVFHLVDMLSPDFAYEPALPQSEGGPVHDQLLTDRYRTLWDVTITARLVRRGWVPSAVRERCLRNFTKAFPMLGARTAEVFTRFFETESHTHPELVAFAQSPTEGPCQPGHGGRCPLCQFPTYTLEPQPDRLSASVIARIQQDFPAWRPAHGVCPQCAELYRARPLSTGAVQQLPKG